MTILINADGCLGVSDVMKNKTSCRTLPLIRLNLRLWRRWWDSNPRARLRTKRFRVFKIVG